MIDTPGSCVSETDLQKFTELIKLSFEAGHIRAPVHLSKGNEQDLLEIFNKRISSKDWVFSNHRSHYHALLKGIGWDDVLNMVLKGQSMHVNSRKHRFFSSSIVGGCCSIALGVALALQLKGDDRIVWCFVGDMAAETGIFHESAKYAVRNDLHLHFIVEDNGLSVNTPTEEVWGKHTMRGGNTSRYFYKRELPHAGGSTWVIF